MKIKYISSDQIFINAKSCDINENKNKRSHLNYENIVCSAINGEITHSKKFLKIYSNIIQNKMPCIKLYVIPNKCF